MLPAPVVFEWKSGYLNEFLTQIKKVFGIDLNQRADIPGEMRYRRVPSMKIKTANVLEVIDLYNSISDDHPESGKWVVKHARNNRVIDELGLLISEPNAIFLVPSKQSDSEDSSYVRAFTLRDIPGPEQEQLFRLIEVEQGRLQKLEAERGVKPSLLRGDVHFHKETGICVATGGRTYVEMVGSLIDAFREGRQLPGRAARPYAPKPQDEK
ncbi:MAG: hypothetical protein DME21_15515 [Verrucomicrobia bacterium]|nr:MAG: hypothetical protein DME21_15515 [Verrucomicrobiota bacterium]